MAPAKLVLAVAGARKTQSIVDACAKSTPSERILILTYTTANQVELRSRLASAAGDRSNIEVMGWFAFLICHIVRPFVPFSFDGHRVRGFDFTSPPQRGTRTDSSERYFTDSDHVRKVHLAQLAYNTELASCGAGLRRLGRLYDKIYIDEVQDLCGYDLEILSLLLDSGIEVEMVGDVRQAVFVTNEREQKNSQYKYMKVWQWFKREEKKGRLSILQACQTWRCHQEVASYADSLFDASWGFDRTTSLNSRKTGHDGLYLVKSSDVKQYVDQFRPLLLRHSKASGKALPYEFTNFKIVKGLSRERVLIYPTDPIKDLLMSGTPLKSQQAAELYVAVTRAEQSVAFILDAPGQCSIPYWSTTTDGTSAPTERSHALVTPSLFSESGW